MERSNKLSSLRSLIPGIVVFWSGALLWLGSAGLLMFIAIPVLLLGSFLLIFSFFVTAHSSRLARVVSACLAIFSVLSSVLVLLPG